MMIGLEPKTIYSRKADEDYNFEYKQKIHLDNVALYYSTESRKPMKFITGDFYVQNFRVRHGWLRIAPTEKICDDKTYRFGYIKASEVKEVK